MFEPILFVRRLYQLPGVRDYVISVALLFPAIRRRKVWIVQQITWQSGVYTKKRKKNLRKEKKQQQTNKQTEI